MKPVITLKNIKHHSGLSQETHAYTATIYVDGKKFAAVSNAGHGGSDEVHPFEGGYPAVEELEKRIKETYPRTESKYFPDGFEQSLESICCDLVNEFLHKREFKKTLKKFAFLQDGKLFTIKKAGTTTLEKVKAASWAKGATFLADLPEDEAFELFKAHS
mgnify:CR=1 FL=1